MLLYEISSLLRLTKNPYPMRQQTEFCVKKTSNNKIEECNGAYCLGRVIMQLVIISDNA